MEDEKDQPVPTSCHSKIPKKHIWMTKDAHGAAERSILRAAAAVTTYPLATVAGFHGLALRLVPRRSPISPGNRGEVRCVPVVWCLKNDVF